MTIEEVLTAQLLAGTPSYAARVYPVQGAQGAATPYLTYNQVSEVVDHAMGSDPNVSIARWQVSCWGQSYAQAKIAADDARAALSRYRATVSGLEVMDIFVELEMDLFDPEALLYHAVVDFLVMHRN